MVDSQKHSTQRGRPWFTVLLDYLRGARKRSIYAKLQEQTTFHSAVPNGKEMAGKMSFLFLLMVLAQRGRLLGQRIQPKLGRLVLCLAMVTIKKLFKL